jgi:hypothetical protein
LGLTKFHVKNLTAKEEEEEEHPAAQQSQISLNMKGARTLLPAGLCQSDEWQVKGRHQHVQLSLNFPYFLVRQYNQPASQQVCPEEKKEKCRGVCRALFGWQHSINRILRRFYILVKAPPPPFSIDKCTNGISACAIETGPREETLTVGLMIKSAFQHRLTEHHREREALMRAHTRHSMQISSIIINARCQL